MWIHKIKLTNFKSYEKVEYFFPKPIQGKNIILIGAENGHGKTTLLESIYLGLYGQNAIRQLSRVGLTDTTYETIMNGALFSNAKAEDYSTLINMSIELVLNSDNDSNEVKGIHIKRSWKYDRKTKKRNVKDDECHIFKISNEGNQAIEPSEHERYINEYGLPYSYAPFFFFDGEKVGEQAKQVGAGTWLKKGLDGLCGITLLSDLEGDLGNYISNCIKDSNPEDQQKLDKLQKEYDELASRNKSNLDKRDSLKNNKIELTQKEIDLQNLLGGVGANAQTTEQIRSKINNIRQTVEQAESNIGNALKAIPLKLIPYNETSLLEQTLVCEANRLQYEDGKNQGESKIEYFLEAFASSPAAQEYVTPKVLRSDGMRKAIQDAWNTLWYPLPSNCAETVKHNYLTLSSHLDIKKTISELPCENTNLEILCDTISNCESEINQLEKELAGLSGTRNDDVLENLKITSSELKDTATKYARVCDSIRQDELRIIEKENVIEEYQQKILGNEPNQIKAKRATELKSIIADLKTQIIKNKLQSVSMVATQINFALSHDERIDQIKIDPNGSFKLKKGDSIVEMTSLSAGQTQILILSMVASLAEVTNYKVPYVIDTPLARLDINHRENLIKYWSKLPQQVILLSQDAEISKEIADINEYSIQKRFLVKAETLSNGGAKSVLTEDAYF